MLFKTFAQKLYRAIGCETTEGDFVFDVLSSVLADKYMKKDKILSKPYANGGRMLRYYFEGTKSICNLAKKLIRYVDAKNFEYLYDNMFEDQPELIRNVVNEFANEIPEINDNNFALKLGKLLVDILFEASRKSIDISEDEYSKLRHDLYEEADGICPITGCQLMISGDNAFKVVKIDKDLPNNFDNTIAISPNAGPTYFYKDSNRHTNELGIIKDKYFEKRRIKLLLDDAFYSKKLKSLIDKLDSNPTALDVSLKLKPMAIKNKIDTTTKLYSAVNPFITDYYLFLSELFKEKDGNSFNFEDLCKNVRANYLKLVEEDLSQEKIFDLLVENLSRKTQQSLLSCEIVISFFIQNCEVFDEISK